ncbi:MAG: chemotaxis protein CheW [bacterium]|nr:chemotaxis protein CheW [bacterium]
MGRKVVRQRAFSNTQYLTFFLAGEEYAAGIPRIREIVHYDALTRVPTTPVWIRGVMNLRGTVVPVVDLAAKLGLPATPLTKRTCMVMVEAELQGELLVIGMMVDEVSRVIELEEIEQALPSGTRAHRDFLLGTGKVVKQSLLILDIDRLLSVEELLTATAWTPVATIAGEGDGEES